MSFAPELRTHAQKVCYLYKKAMRQIESYYGQRNVVRYHQVILRARFDQNKCVSDPKDQRRLYWVGENELFETKHPGPIAKFPRSIGLAGGVAAGRVVEPPDWVLDYWHPLEKAQYPEYFECREIRKAEYICKWQKGEMIGPEPQYYLTNYKDKDDYDSNFGKYNPLKRGVSIPPPLQGLVPAHFKYKIVWR